MGTGRIEQGRAGIGEIGGDKVRKELGRKVGKEI